MNIEGIGFDSVLNFISGIKADNSDSISIAQTQIERKHSYKRAPLKVYLNRRHTGIGCFALQVCIGWCE